MGACQAKKIRQRQIKSMKGNEEQQYIFHNPEQQEQIRIAKIQMKNQLEIKKRLNCLQCKKQFAEDQIVQIKECQHYYDIQCFVAHFQQKGKCCTDQRIIINEKIYPQLLVIEIMKYKLKELINKIAQKELVVQCPTQFCSFLFIYKKEFNNQQQKKFYCIRCEQFMVYDQKMCQFIEMQTVLKVDNKNDAEIFQNLDSTDFNCNIQDHLMITNITALLPCNHQWCKKCLFINYKDCLRANCFCGKRYSTKIIKDFSKDDDWGNIYERQLNLIQKQVKLSFQFCKNNCGFFYILDQDRNEDSSFCIKCDEIRICKKCDKEVLSQYVTINKCKHYYHLLCSYELLMNNSLKDMSCQCGVKLDNITKVDMNITCLFCQKYDDDLIMLQCCHFVHKECLIKNLNYFSSFQCVICQIPIGNIFNEPRFLIIKEKLLEIQQNNNQCQQCQTNYLSGNNNKCHKHFKDIIQYNEQNRQNINYYNGYS